MVRKILAPTIFFLWCVTPLFLLVILSFAVRWPFPNILPVTFTVTHWQKFIFDTNGLQHAFFNSLFIAIIVSLAATTFGFLCSHRISFHPFKSSLLKLTYLPFALSPVIFAVCLKFYFLKTGLAGNMPGVIVAQLIVTLPYATIFFMSFWNPEVKHFRDVAFTLGSTKVVTYQKVILPLAKSFIITCFFQCFIISWFEYGLTMIIGYGKVPTLTIKVFQFIGEANIYYAALASCLLVLPPVLMLWLNKKFVFTQTR